MGLRKLVVCLAAGIVAAFVFLAPLQQAYAQTNFSDLDKNDWGYDGIQYLVDEGVINGYPDGTFRPNASLEREQAAKMVGAALGYGGKKRDTSFPDVNPNNYASGYIQFGVKQDFIHGYPDGTFRPNRKMERDEMAWLITGAFSLDNMSKSLPYSDMEPDMNSYDVINKVTTAGITNGYPNGSFQPNSKITRREFALMVARSMNSKFIQSQSVISQGVVTATTLNVRKGPSTNYRVAGQLSRGTQVQIYEKDGGWGLVTGKNVKGFVSLRYIHEKSEPALKDRVIVLDAGHGGSDPGAVNDELHIKEKNVNLDVVLKVANRLNQAGANVVLTRKGDNRLTNGFSLGEGFNKAAGLQARVNISANAGSEAFVSVHANYFNDKVGGTENYYHLYVTDKEQTRRSKKLATFTHERIVAMTDLRDRFVKQDTIIYPDSGFHVLRENIGPSTLIELGFISKDEEAKKLASNAWQNTAAKAITLGIKDYFKWLMEQQQP